MSCRVVPCRATVTVSPAELVAGITDVVAGGGTLSAAATAALIGHMSDTPPPADQKLLRRFDAQTPRERDVILLVAGGLSNDEIAAQMFVSPLTVKTHAVRAMTKVGAQDLCASAHRVLIITHLAEGDLVEARRAYAAYSTLVRRELGVPPGRPVRELAAAWSEDPVGQVTSRREGWGRGRRPTALATGQRGETR